MPKGHTYFAIMYTHKFNNHIQHNISSFVFSSYLLQTKHLFVHIKYIHIQYEVIFPNPSKHKHMQTVVMTYIFGDDNKSLLIYNLSTGQFKTYLGRKNFLPLIPPLCHELENLLICTEHLHSGFVASEGQVVYIQTDILIFLTHNQFTEIETPYTICQKHTSE